MMWLGEEHVVRGPLHLTLLLRSRTLFPVTRFALVQPCIMWLAITQATLHRLSLHRPNQRAAQITPTTEPTFKLDRASREIVRTRHR